MTEKEILKAIEKGRIIKLMNRKEYEKQWRAKNRIRLNEYKRNWAKENLKKKNALKPRCKTCGQVIKLSTGSTLTTKTKRV